MNEAKIKISFISDVKTMDVGIKDFEENDSVSLIFFIRQEKLVSGPYQNTYLKPARAAKDIKPVSSSRPFLSYLA